MYALTEEMLIEQLADSAMKDKQDSHAAVGFHIYRPYMCVHS